VKRNILHSHALLSSRGPCAHTYSYIYVRIQTRPRTRINTFIYSLRANISENKAHAPARECKRERERFAKRIIPSRRIQRRRQSPSTCPSRNQYRLSMLQRPIAPERKQRNWWRRPTLRLRQTFRRRSPAAATHVSIC